MGWPGPMTHRQFEAWHEWLKRQWNIPSRTDYQIMALASEVHDLKYKHQELVKYQVKHEYKKVEQIPEDQLLIKPMTKESIAKARIAIHKARMMKMMEGPPIKGADGTGS